MIKATGRQADGKPFVLLGLSRENCRRLLEGQPIKIDMADLGQPERGTVLICAGETEEAVKRELIEAGLELPS